VERRGGDRLVIAEADPAEVNARLVAAGLRVSEIGPERRSLEELMLAVTGSGSDRIDPVRKGVAGAEAAGGCGAGEALEAAGGCGAGEAPAAERQAGEDGTER
jgi:hypothetical protein